MSETTASKPSKAPTTASKLQAKGNVAAPAKKPSVPRLVFDQKIADLICIMLSEGTSLRKILKDDKAGILPAQSTIYEWLLRYPLFAEQYTRAREEQADTLADEIVDIADEQPEVVVVTDRDGKVIEHKLDNAYLQWQKNRIEARKWTAMKLKPKKYGEKLALAGDADNPVKIEAVGEAQGLLEALLLNVELKKQV